MIILCAQFEIVQVAFEFWSMQLINALTYDQAIYISNTWLSNVLTF